MKTFVLVVSVLFAMNGAFLLIRKSSDWLAIIITLGLGVWGCAVLWVAD